ncbi:sensor histidine kinase [Humibacter soli]
MSLGMPAQVAREAGNRAIATSTQVGALICLGAAFISVLAPGFFLIGGVQWWAAGILLPMAALVIVVMVTESKLAMLAYVVVGCVSTFAYTVAVLQQTPSYTNTNLFVIALPLIALMLIGGSGHDTRVGVLWATAAYGLGDLAVFVASVVVGRQFRLDSVSLTAYVLFMALLLFHGVTRGWYRGAHALILRTLREQHIDEVRLQVAAELRAELHDTTLSELAALATAQPGPLAPKLRERLESDIRHWTTGPHRAQERRNVSDRTEWRESELARAIDHARDSGLVVDVTGDRRAYAELPPEVRRALGLAARQCLVNVLNHSGQSNVELAVSASHDEVSILIVDPGRGFDVSVISRQGSDRLGILHSVVDRIERVGGSVSIYSKPGAGTTVLMFAPRTGGGATE